ncbi:hypothetical protein B0H67DRAFT_126266 [Lasiosphaeris hirsuta]|uniref:Uncharacterized protein n=1 Tax=Lasiosphaeris hirsuta TaxID=260670 RepID=A0AA40B0B1_9PEZI|nr:hypothetical protein B0H67DRAFT_126266 [Lasiosphaeris hirsuta]
MLRNGCVDAFIQLRDNGPRHLPGSSDPIITLYCGFPPFDQLLTLASVMFANVVDGSCPRLSVYGIQFGGQFLSILVLIMIESMREGNQHTIFRLRKWEFLRYSIDVGSLLMTWA